MTRAKGKAGNDHTVSAGVGVVSHTPEITRALPTLTDVLGEYSDALPGGTRLHEFEIVSVIGHGGFGIVYLVQDHSLDRRVAVKEYMPSSLAARRHGKTVQVRSQRHEEAFDAGMRSFINEARLLALFEHPSLPKVHRYWEANGTAYMAMTYYEGVTLGQRLHALGRPPDERWLIALLRPLLDALALMHEAHCFHRDISPDNILIRTDGAPMLLDFGAARMVIGDMTKALTVILKPGYAPIEQYGDLPAVSQGAWTDLYALGSVMHFAITGKTPPQAIARFMKDAYVPLATTGADAYGERFLQAIDRSLAVEPSKRPQSAAEMLRLLGLQRADRQTMAEDSKVIAASGSWVATHALPAVADDEATVLRPVAGPVGPTVALPVALPVTPPVTPPVKPPVTRPIALPANMPHWLHGTAPHDGRRRLVFGAIGAVGIAAAVTGAFRWRSSPQRDMPDEAKRVDPETGMPAASTADLAGLPPPAAGPASAQPPSGPAAVPAPPAAAVVEPAPAPAAVTEPVTAASQPESAPPTPPSPAPPPADIAPARPPAITPSTEPEAPVPAPRHSARAPPRASPPATARSHGDSATEARCADIIQRASLGEDPSEAEKTFLKQECAR